MKVQKIGPRFNKSPKLQLRSFPPEVILHLKKNEAEILAEMESKGGLTAEIIQSQRDYLKHVLGLIFQTKPT